MENRKEYIEELIELLKLNRFKFLIYYGYNVKFLNNGVRKYYYIFWYMYRVFKLFFFCFSLV